MSAITGIFYRDGRTVKPEIIKKMKDKLSHRGPDGSAIWCDGPIALGHQMLWTTPESLHEKLPFHDEKAGLVITADARIDNRKELSEELDIEDKEFISDSYFILKSYEKWGDKCPEHLLGDFAFAIWDENEEILFCARDHMGVKPFYYYISDEGVFFATEMKALFTIDEIPSKLNEQKIIFHLMAMNLDKLCTFYEKIFSLTAAHYIKIDRINNSKIKYWELDPESKILMDSDEDYINSFREIFEEAVNCRLRSAFPIGFELSGGLDSSSVVCTAKKILNNKSSVTELNTFSWVFDEFPEVDEREYIQKILDTGDIKSHFLHCDQISPLEEMETILWYQEQPFYSPNMSLKWKLYRKMQENDIRVLLSGNGGDEIISHSGKYLTELIFTFKWIKAINEIYFFSKNYNASFFKLFLNMGIYPLIPVYLKNYVKKWIFPLIGKKINKFNSYDCFILNKGFAKNFGGKEYLKEFKEGFTKENNAAKNHYFEINNFSHQYIMEMLDRTSSPFSIEPRYPFFDKRLVEFCYAIPTEMKFKFGWNRYILRAGMDNILPKEIQWRSRKKYFDPIFKRNLLLFEKDLLEDIFFNDSKIIEDYVDLSLIKSIYEEYSSGNKVNASIYIWLVTILYFWLKESSISYCK
jgi:asparagine synthase (glutamine-hydrolysing)